MRVWFCVIYYFIHLDHVTSLIFILLLEFQAKNGAEWWSGNFHLEYRDTYVFFLEFILVPCRNFDFSIVFFLYISSKHLLKYGTKIGVSKLVLKFNSYIQFYTSYIYLQLQFSKLIMALVLKCNFQFLSFVVESINLFLTLFSRDMVKFLNC